MPKKRTTPKYKVQSNVQPFKPILFVGDKKTYNRYKKAKELRYGEILHVSHVFETYAYRPNECYVVIGQWMEDVIQSMISQGFVLGYMETLNEEERAKLWEKKPMSPLWEEQVKVGYTNLFIPIQELEKHVFSSSFYPLGEYEVVDTMVVRRREVESWGVNFRLKGMGNLPKEIAPHLLEEGNKN